MVGPVANIHVVMGSKVSSKHQGQLWVQWQFQGPWLSLCATEAAGSHHCYMAMEVDVGSQAGVCRWTVGGVRCW